MNDFLNKNRAIIMAFSGVLAVGMLILLLGRSQVENSDDGIILATSEEDKEEDVTVEKKLKVDISGAVKNPGVYDFEDGQIVDDALEAAGGLTDEADTDYVSKNINRAKKLEDAEKIYIPLRGVNVTIQGNNEEGTGSSGKININTATAEELDTLPGIGPSYAERIIAGRPYAKIEDLKEVKGIGSNIFEKIRDKITV
jgi:competence protein ComEA